MNKTLKHVRGFTLVEVLISLALIATISLILMGALAPWVGMKQKLDTERRLQDVRQGVAAIYEAQAMAIERSPAGTFSGFSTNASDPGSGGCVLQDAGFTANAQWFSEPPQAISRDGYGNPWCIRVSVSLKEVRDGADLWFRNVIVISTGPDGALNAATSVSPLGVLTLGGDDVGITVTGREIQASKLQETLRRMTRAGQTYETYFTVRFLANASRDITVDYFSTAYDPGGQVASTSGAWAKVALALGGIGVSGQDALSAWELDNSLEVGNFNETVNGVQVRSPGSTGTGNLPFTAQIRARLPAPSGMSVYASQGVIGNY